MFTYTFDRAGDRLSSVGNRGLSSVTNAAGFSKIQKIDGYGYDTLHRLTQVDYNNTWQTLNEDYVYDELGNRVTYSDHRNSITRGYANNAANEYTSVVSNGVTQAVAHDDAGNLASQVVNAAGDAYEYTYDCDNRLLSVTFDPATGGDVPLATFAYDALGRKITAWTQYDVQGGTQGDSNTSDLRFYHDGQVEIADYYSDGSLARRFVNGTQYIDERAVLIEGEAGDNGAPVDAETFYYLLQELYTVTGVMKVNGTLTEAETFDGYGAVRLWHYSDGDFNRDAAVNATDQTRFTAALAPTSGIPAADPLADLDLDGDVDLADSATFTTIKNSGGAMTQLFISAAGNPFHFTGRRLYMLETLPESDTTPVPNQQLQHNRARHYAPLEGRWLQRDPAGYLDGLNLYEFMGNHPPFGVDPLGLDWLDNLANFVAGVGDSLSFGLTAQVRSAIEWGAYGGSWEDPMINPNSGYYLAGEIVEVTVEIAVTAGGASLRHVAKRTVRESIEGGARTAFRRANKLEGGIVSHINPILGHPGGKPARFPLPFEFAAQGSWNMEHISTGTVIGDRVAHLDYHRYLMRLEALDRLRTATMGVRQATNAVFAHVGCSCFKPSVSISTSFSGEAVYYSRDYSESSALGYTSTSASASLIETSTIRCHASGR
ncbi:MAG: hypothetical protein IT449_12715 [Phycisphaerales bacterium]|nr:hypothetical protein [Phycisphaerales bacterium]